MVPQPQADRTDAIEQRHEIGGIFTESSDSSTSGGSGGGGGWFQHVAKRASTAAGHPMTFALASGSVVIWAAMGPVFGFSDTWQLVINTSTTIITFLMVFLIQNTQNRDTGAMQVKLDELIRATKGADKALLDLEELDERDLEKIRADYERLAEQARNELDRRPRPQPQSTEIESPVAEK